MEKNKPHMCYERKRTYTFICGEGCTYPVELNYVQELIVTDSGTHKIKTADKLHIIPTGWIHCEIETYGEGKPEWTV